MAAERAAARLSQPEIQHTVTAQAICSIRINGRYLFAFDPILLAAGEHVLSPLGGFYQRDDHRDWRRAGFANGRGQEIVCLPVSAEKVEQAVDYVRSGQHRETTPMRALNQTLVTKIGRGALNGDDLRLHFRESKTDEIVHTGTYGQPIYDHRCVEIYDVELSPKAQEAIKEAVRNPDSGLVFLTAAEVKHVDTISCYGQRLLARCTVDCQDVLCEKACAIIPEQERDDNIVYRLAKQIAFSAEGAGPGPKHRLTEADLDFLRKYADPQLVNRLEKAIVGNRLLVLAWKTLLGGLAESALMYSAINPGKRYELAFFLCALGAKIICEAQENQSINKLENRVGECLGDVMHDIAIKYQADERLNQMESLDDWGEQITRTMAAAERFVPYVHEMTPTALLNTYVLIMKNPWYALLNLTIAGSTYPLVSVALTSDGPPWLRRAREKFTYLASSGAKYAPIAIARLLPAANLGLAIIAGSFIADHFADGLEGGNYMRDALRAKREIYKTLSRLNASIVTDGQRIAHAARIRAQHQSIDAGPCRMAEGQLINSLPLVHTIRQPIRLFLRRQRPTVDTQVIIDPDKSRKAEAVFSILSGRQQIFSPIHLRRHAGPKSNFPNRAEMRFLHLDQVAQSLETRGINAQTFADFSGYTLVRKDVAIIDDSDLVLRSGAVHLLEAPQRGGLTTILKSLGEKLDHPRGKGYLRLDHGDYEIHEHPDKQLVGYQYCGRTDHRNSAPMFGNAPFVGFEPYLRSTGLFSSREIQILADAYSTRIFAETTRQIRSKLNLAAAAFSASGNEEKTVIFLDDLFCGDLNFTREDLKRVIEFLETLVKQGKIILIGVHQNDRKHYKALNDRGLLGDIFTVQGRKFVQVN